MQEALELGRQNHVHEDGRQQESDDQVGRGLVQHLHHARKSMAEPSRQPYIPDLLADRPRRLVQRHSRPVVGAHRNLKLAVVPLDSRGAEPSRDGGDVVEPDLSHLR